MSVTSTTKASTKPHGGTAEIYKRTTWKLKTEYRFRIIGANGEQIAQGEGYTAKHNVKDVLSRYFPDYPVKDLSIE